MVTDHRGNLSSSQKSVVILSTLLFDTDILSGVSVPTVKLSQCRRHHRIQLITIWEIVFPKIDRGVMRSSIDCAISISFDPSHDETRILCFRAYFCSQIHFPKSCHFAVLLNSLISLASGPPTSSVPGVATPLASVSPRASKAQETCCWSGSYSIPHCRNVSVLPKTFAVRDCDDSGPKSHNFSQLVCTSQQTQCMPSPLLSTHYEKKHRRAPECRSPSLCGKNDTETPRKSSSLQNLTMMLSPPLGCIQRSVHCFSQFHTHAWLLCLGVLVWQSNVDVANFISVEVSSTHVSGGDQERVFNSKNIFLTRNTE